METVREMIRKMQAEVRETEDLTPARACMLELAAASLIGNCNTELRAADRQYRAVYLTHFRALGKANCAKIEAEASPEYDRLVEVRHVREECIELVRSLRNTLRVMAEEMRLQR
jgi:hypothetical protein